jgi:hypothetical protein
MLIIGALIALGVAMACVGVTGCAAVEPESVTAPVIRPQPVIDRRPPLLPGPEPLISDRESLKRYFLQDSPNQLRR